MFIKEITLMMCHKSLGKKFHMYHIALIYFPSFFPPKAELQIIPNKANDFTTLMMRWLEGVGERTDNNVQYLSYSRKEFERANSLFNI